MNKIWIVTGTEYQTKVEKYHTRTVLIEHNLAACSTKEHAEELADTFASKGNKYLQDSINVKEYELIGQTYHNFHDEET